MIGLHTFTGILEERRGGEKKIRRAESIIRDVARAPLRRPERGRYLAFAAVCVVAVAAIVVESLRPGASSPAAAVLAPEILALAQETRAGGVFQIEVDSKGRITAYSAEIDVASVPAACLRAADVAAPGGRIARVEKMVIDAITYYEILKDKDGLAVEILTTIDGKVEGREDQLDADDAPAGVLAAADRAVPDGTLVAVERVQGPEAGGGVEHHVKKVLDGEVRRIRVRDGQAVEVLRKLRAEVKVPRGE